MEVRYSTHFQERQTLRDFPSGLAEQVFFNADAHFYDTQTGTLVAVRRLNLYNSLRDVALIYRMSGEETATFITIHPLRDGQLERRIQTNRWTPYDAESVL